MNTNLISKIEKEHLKKIPELRPGDTVRVHQKIKEGGKERIQVFEGVVLKVKGGNLRQSFLVRKVSFGIGIEKNFLIHSPNIAKIEIKKRAKVRQAYLTYLRKLTGKSARLKDKQFDMLAVNIKEEEPIFESLENDEPQKDVSDSASSEAALDKEVTELSKEEMADAAKNEVPLEVVEKAEAKEMAVEDAEGQDGEDTTRQIDEVEEIESGVEKAEHDLAKGKATEGGKAEKTKESISAEDIKEEVSQEK